MIGWCLLTDLPEANLVLDDTIERIYHGSEYAEQRVGLFIIRGENVVLLGEIVSRITIPGSHAVHSSSKDLDVEDEVPLQKVQFDTLKHAYANDLANKKHREHDKAQVLYEQRGYCREGGEGDGY